MVQAQVSNVDSVIYHEVTRLVSCPLDELAQRLPAYSWAQVFAAVDRLSRQGTLRLSRTSRFGYMLSVVQILPSPVYVRPERPGVVWTGWLIHTSPEGRHSESWDELSFLREPV
jgi:hypothetical protein